MPTTTEQAAQIKEIVGVYIDTVKAEKLFKDLHQNVGSKSDNLSVKLSLLMLEILHRNDGKTVEEKMQEAQEIFKSYYPKETSRAKRLLVTVVVVHFAAILGMVAAFFVLPFTQPWPVWLPLCVFILNLMFTAQPCAMTKAENWIRKELGMPQVKLFIGYYLRKLFD